MGASSSTFALKSTTLLAYLRVLTTTLAIGVLTAAESLDTGILFGAGTFKDAFRTTSCCLLLYHRPIIAELGEVCREASGGSEHRRLARLTS